MWSLAVASGGVTLVGLRGVRPPLAGSDDH